METNNPSVRRSPGTLLPFISPNWRICNPSRYEHRSENASFSWLGLSHKVQQRPSDFADVGPNRDLPMESRQRRDPLVASAALRLIIHPASAGTINVPLRGSALLEGPACQVRGITFDNPSHFGGHDKHAPPNGHNKRVR